MSLKQPVPSKQITNAMLGGVSDSIYPQQLYVLGLEDLISKSMRGAKLSGWRFMGSLGGPDFSMDVESDSRGKAPALTELSQGPHITNARNAIRKIIKSPEVRAHHFELRLLTIPALSVEAVWLKSQSRAADLMVPYLTIAGLKPMQFYPLDKFLGALEPAAKTRIGFDDSPRMLRRPRAAKVRA